MAECQARTSAPHLVERENADADHERIDDREVGYYRCGVRSEGERCLIGVYRPL
jgi:hypothetical protein